MTSGLSAAGKVALVTGGARGIGAAIAGGLLAIGAVGSFAARGPGGCAGRCPDRLARSHHEGPCLAGQVRQLRPALAAKTL